MFIVNMYMPVYIEGYFRARFTPFFLEKEKKMSKEEVDEMIELVKTNEYELIKQTVSRMSMSKKDLRLKTVGLIISVILRLNPVAKLFVEAGANVNQMPIYCSFDNAFTDNLDTAKALSLPVLIACKDGNFEMFDFLLHHGADVNLFPVTDVYQMAFLIRPLLPSEDRTYVKLKDLMDSVTHKHTDPSYMKFCRLLYTAAEENYEDDKGDIIQFLLKRALSDMRGCSLDLFYACGYNKDPIFMDRLLECDLERTPSSMFDYFLLRDKDELAKRVVSRFANDVTLWLEKYGMVPLHLATYYGRVEVIKYLLEIGADVDEKKNEFTALMNSEIIDGLEACKALVHGGADVLMKYSNGSHCGFLSEQRKDNEVSVYLRQKIVDVLVSRCTKIMSGRNSGLSTVPVDFRNRVIGSAIRIIIERRPVTNQ